MSYKMHANQVYNTD